MFIKVPCSGVHLMNLEALYKISLKLETNKELNCQMCQQFIIVNGKLLKSTEWILSYITEGESQRVSTISVPQYY